MSPERLVGRVLDDESLTNDLDEAEASLVVGWLVKHAESLAVSESNEKEAFAKLEALCKLAKTIPEAARSSEARNCSPETLTRLGWNCPTGATVPSEGFIPWLLERYPPKAK